MKVSPMDLLTADNAPDIRLPAIAIPYPPLDQQVLDTMVGEIDIGEEHAEPCQVPKQEQEN